MQLWKYFSYHQKFLTNDFIYKRYFFVFQYSLNPFLRSLIWFLSNIYYHKESLVWSEEHFAKIIFTSFSVFNVCKHFTVILPFFSNLQYWFFNYFNLHIHFEKPKKNKFRNLEKGLIYRLSKNGKKRSYIKKSMMWKSRFYQKLFLIMLSNFYHDRHRLKITLKCLKRGLSYKISESGKMTVKCIMRQK